MCYYPKNEFNQLDNQVRHDTKIKLSENEFSIAAWVYKHSSKAGKHTDTLPSTDYTFYPLTGNSDNMGVIAVGQPKFLPRVKKSFGRHFSRKYQVNMNVNFYGMLPEKHDILNESEKLYKTLFNSISHELRIPVATIIGASDTLIIPKLS